MTDERKLKLSPKHQRFAEEYIRTLNASEAARVVGYSTKAVGKIMQRPHIKAAIEAAKEERSARCRIDADSVLTHLGEMLNADIQDITDELGRFKPITQWPNLATDATGLRHRRTV